MIHTFTIGNVTIGHCELEAGGKPRRQAERLACEAVAKHITGHCGGIMHRSDGAPYLPGCEWNISVSHSRSLAVVAACRTQAVGVDAEQWRPQLRRVSGRFLSEEELRLFTTDEQLLKAWTIKEAVYKIAGPKAWCFSDAIRISPDMSRAIALGREYTLHTFDIGANTVTLAL